MNSSPPTVPAAKEQQRLPGQVRLLMGTGVEAVPRALHSTLARIVMQEMSPIFIAYLDARSLFANDDYLTLFEISSRSPSALDRHFTDLQAELDEIVDDLRRGSGRLVMQRTVQRSAGPAYYRVHYFPIFDNARQLTAVGGIYFDITGQVTALDRMRSSQDALNDVLRAASDWIWSTDEANLLTFISDRITDVVGLPAAVLLGRGITALAGPEPDRAMLSQLNQALAERRPFRNVAVDVRDRDGATRQHVLSGVPFFDPKTGAFSGFRGAGSDVSRQHAAEQTALVSNRQLQSALKQLSSQNEILMMTLERERASARAKADFLANMSHELRTPLNAIIGFSDMLKQQFFGGLSEKQAEYVSHILGSGKHLLEVVSDILDMSKMGEGKVVLKEDTVDVLAAIQDCLPMVATDAVKSEVELILDVRSPPPPLRADEVRLKQILINLLSNAVKFTPGPGRITVATEVTDRNEIEILVIDSGIGMTPEEISLAMLPFQQIENPFVKTHEGTGLGLPLANKLVEMHEGRLTIDSTPGSGTSVRISFPAERTIG
ncbi:MAG TPA: PAS domain-containing sensor histidine kinase [Stellaceae bacterium]|nr:PAS domain-containing sensor histidine kinase [Stellaceae bacterium]